MLNDIAQNKANAMLNNAMMENYESRAVADRYDNIVDSDEEFEVMDNTDIENMDNGDDSVIEDESIININEDEITEDSWNRISTNSLLLLKEKAETTEKSKLSINIIAAIELMALLRSCGASLNLYDKIVAWLEHRIPHNLNESLPTREKVIKMMEKRYNLKCMSPVKTAVILPSINLPVEIPVNPLLGCIYSLLSDDKIMTSDNLIFANTNNPSQITPYSGNYSEINTVLSYQSFQQSVNSIDKAVPVPLIFSLMELPLIMPVIIHKHLS